MSTRHKYNFLAARVRILEAKLAFHSFGDAVTSELPAFADAQCHSHALHMEHNMLVTWPYHFPTQAASAARSLIGEPAYRHARKVHRHAAGLRHPQVLPLRIWRPRSTLSASAP